MSLSDEGATQQTEVDALRGILRDQSIARAEARETIVDANTKLRAKLEELEKSGAAVVLSDFEEIFGLYENIRVLIQPNDLDPSKPGSYSFNNQQFAGKERNERGELSSGGTGVVTDKRVIEAGGVDGISTR